MVVITTQYHIRNIYVSTKRPIIQINTTLINVLHLCTLFSNEWSLFSSYKCRCKDNKYILKKYSFRLRNFEWQNNGCKTSGVRSNIYIVWRRNRTFHLTVDWNSLSRSNKKTTVSDWRPLCKNNHYKRSSKASDGS